MQTPKLNSMQALYMALASGMGNLTPEYTDYSVVNNRVNRSSAKFARSPEVRYRLIREAVEKRTRKNFKRSEDYVSCTDRNSCLVPKQRIAK